MTPTQILHTPCLNPNPEQARQMTLALLGGYADPEKTYPRPLPPALQPWYGYARDAGHSVVVALKCDYQRGLPPKEFLCAAPVKAVIRDYEIVDGYVVVNLPYSPTLGLLTNPSDDEF